MDDNLYKVVFSGRLVPGVSGKQALERLAQLFRKSPDDIRDVFSRPGSVLRRNLTLAKAEKMLAGLMRAGVVCQIQEMTTEALPALPSSSVSEQPRILTIVEEGPNILTLMPVTSDDSLAPIACDRLTAVAGGLETSRLDRSFIAYSDILAAALITPAEESSEFLLMLLSVGNKRPLIIKGIEIDFSSCPEVKNANLSTSLHNFLYFLAAQNPELCVDEKTAAFISGATSKHTCSDLVRLSSELYAALDETRDDLERTPIPAPLPGTAAALRSFRRRDAEGIEAEDEALYCLEPDSYDSVRKIDQRAELEGWVDLWPLPLGLALLIGFLLPISRQVLFENLQAIWFWNLLGFGIDEQKLSDIKGLSTAQGSEFFLFLPLLSAVLVLLTAFAVPRRWRGPVLFVAGAVPLILPFAFGGHAPELFDVRVIPERMTGGLILLLLGSALAIAAVNHLGQQGIKHLHLRVLQAVGGLGLLVMTIFVCVISGWKVVAMYPLYAVWLSIALLAFHGAIRGGHNRRSRLMISILFRTVLVLTPIVLIVNSFSIEQGDGVVTVVPMLVAVLKVVLIYYGMAMAVGVGLAQMLGRWYAGRGPLESEVSSM